MNNRISEDEIVKTWNMVFNISLNMLHNEHDAEDATQAIFEKVIAGFDKFEGRSKFGTWVYRIAYNYLVDMKRSRFRDEISFEIFERDVSDFEPYRDQLGLTPEEEKIYIEQIKTGCTMAMLQCLDRETRMIFIFGSIFCMAGKDAAFICGISEDTYRKKLSRAKEKMKNFMENNCGLINSEARCRCRKRILIASENGRINSDFNIYMSVSRTIAECTDEINELDASSQVFRENLFHDKSGLYFSRMKDSFRLLRENRIMLTDE